MTGILPMTEPAEPASVGRNDFIPMPDNLPAYASLPNEDERMSFLHLSEGIRRSDKAAWVRAANAAGTNLENWVIETLNRAAGITRKPTTPKTKKA
jgi:hypothetical protein